MLIVATMLTACTDNEQQNNNESAGLDNMVLPAFDTAQFRQGQAVWNANCKVCHATGLAGAPKITDKQAWAARIAKGKSVLYEHAMRGFMGPAGTEMPARGGNDGLSDKQVMAAVDYMVAASQ